MSAGYRNKIVVPKMIIVANYLSTEKFLVKSQMRI